MSHQSPVCPPPPPLGVGLSEEEWRTMWKRELETPLSVRSMKMKNFRNLEWFEMQGKEDIENKDKERMED